MTDVPTTAPRAEVALGRAIDVRDRPGNAAALETRGVAAWFGKNQILGDISLSMPARSVTAIIGPSGCGKSTFLRVLNRMHELVPGAKLAGEVLLDGADVYDASMRPAETRRRIGMVFQKPNPFPTMSIRENVLSGLSLAGERVRGRDADAVVERCLAHAGLWNEVKDRLGEPGGALSGGQQQRLCIARALAVSPRVLLMDEPCSALDPSSTRRIEDTIREVADEVTVVIVTHNMQQAARVSDRTAFFLGDEGRPGGIVEVGPTKDIFTAPNDPRTEDYINGRFG
jgi:phosphate transport system ATP-binding protein